MQKCTDTRAELRRGFCIRWEDDEDDGWGEALRGGGSTGRITEGRLEEARSPCLGCASIHPHLHPSIHPSPGLSGTFWLILDQLWSCCPSWTYGLLCVHACVCRHTRLTRILSFSCRHTVFQPFCTFWLRSAPPFFTLTLVIPAHKRVCVRVCVCTDTSF